jgi:hypothetical protein
MLEIKIQSTFSILLYTVSAGLLFSFLRIPLPWMLGPITGALIYNTVNSSRADWPVALRNLGLIVMGYSMGRTITAETANHILTELPAMFSVTMLTLLFSAGIGYITHRRTGISLASGVLGSMPGGLMQMVYLAEEIKGVDLTVVTLMQTSRILVVIFIIPFAATYGISTHVSGGMLVPPTAIDSGLSYYILPGIVIAPVGAWLACRLKLPTPYLLGPIIGTAVAVLGGFPAPPAPREVLNMAQLFFGTSMGIGITMGSLKGAGKILRYAIGGALLLVSFTFLLSCCLTLFTSATLLTTFLSTAPGGMTEMGVTAIILHSDTASVVAYQSFRLFSILLAVPALLKRWFKR